MLKPDFKKFTELSRTANRIPVCREYLADMETPVSVLNRFKEDDNVFLLESVEGGERFGRYSFIGVDPYGVFSIENGVPYLCNSGGKRKLEFDGKAFFALRELLKDVKIPEMPELPPLFGGAVGFLGYETVNEFEHLPPPKDQANPIDAAFLLTDSMIVFDNMRHTVMICVCVPVHVEISLEKSYENALKQIDVLHERVFIQTPSKTEPCRKKNVSLRPNMDRESFCAMIERAKEHIRKGDVIQVVLSQKFSVSLGEVPPLDLYRALRLINPSPYTFFLKIGERILIGSSPETMVRLTDGVAALRPIAGTRKRGRTEQEDRILADELLKDEKERAEHLMLVDLGRNDLGRIAKPGAVQVRSFMRVERYSHVMHLVSDVEAVAAEGRDAFDLVASAFPAGTLSGAPKIRAMELIHELEPESRGAYGGAVGYFSYTGNMDLAITIRTMSLEDGMVSIQAGAGIVYDSDPEKEYEETLNKAAAVFQALKLAGNGLEI